MGFYGISLGICLVGKGEGLAGFLSKFLLLFDQPVEFHFQLVFVPYHRCGLLGDLLVLFFGPFDGLPNLNLRIGVFINAVI